MADFLKYAASAYLWNGMLISLQITAVAMTLALMLGLGLALLREARSGLLRTPAMIYTWFMRGTPLLLQLVFLYTALPEIGVTLGPVATAIVGFTLNEAAFSGEIIRGGIRSVNRDQRIAAESLGMGAVLTLRRIILPQALRAIMPALGNDAISMLKFTSLASVIAVDELTLRSQTIVAQNFQFFQVFCAAGLLYLAVTTVMSIGQSRIEQGLQLDRADRRGGGSFFARLLALPARLSLGGGGEPIATPPASRARHGTLGAAELVARQALAGVTQDDGVFVTCRGVSKSYGFLEVLKGVDLTVKRGEVVVLMGPSGSGKSTLLRLINHLESIDGGEDPGRR